MHQFSKEKLTSQEEIAKPRLEVETVVKPIETKLNVYISKLEAEKEMLIRDAEAAAETEKLALEEEAR